MYVVRVNDIPACYKPKYFPRKFRYEKQAVEAAKAAVANGASFARIEYPGGGGREFWPPAGRGLHGK